MSLTGRELDLDNTKLGMGGGRMEGSCSFVLWLLVLGVWGVYEASEKRIWEESPYQTFCPARERGVYVTKSGPSRDYKSSNITTAALSQNSSRSNYRSQSSYISPLDSPLRVSHVSHERHPTSLART